MPLFNTLLYRFLSLCIRATILLFLWPGALGGQTVPETHSDLELFNRQIARNCRPYIDERRRHLLRTTPFDSLAINYIEKGFKGSLPDTVYIQDFFDEDRTIITREQEPYKLKELYDVARRYNSPSLELAADFIKGRIMSYDPSLYETQMEWFEQVIRKARRQGDPNMVAHVLTEMWKVSHWGDQHARSFEYAKRLEEALDDTDEDYAYKGLQYIWLALAYHRYKDDERALHFFHKDLSYRDPSHELFAGNYLRAWTYLAEHHYGKNNLDSAAYYYRTILASPESVVYFPFHTTNAIGSLGRIEMKKGNIEAAIEMMEAALAHMIPDHRERFMAAQLHTSLAESYLLKGDMQLAKHHLEEAKVNLDKFSEDYKQQFLKEWYAVNSKFYAAGGNPRLSAIYLDSALVATSAYEVLTGRHIIMLGEQRLTDAELEIKNSHISRQRGMLVMTLLIIGILAGAMTGILFLYRRRNAAYKSLVTKAEQWANCEGCKLKPVNGDKTVTEVALTEEEMCLAEKLGEYMTTHEPYTDPDLRLDTLALMTGISRNQLSRIINKSFGVNFNQFVNEYRIKYAIRILSDPKSKKLSTEQIIDCVGFSSRTAFYASFKQATGLTPAQYRKAKTGLNSDATLYREDIL